MKRGATIWRAATALVVRRRAVLVTVGAVAAMACLVWWHGPILRALVPMARPGWDDLAAKDQATAEGQFRLAAVQAAVGMGAAIALLYTARNYRLAHRGQVTDRFTKALERLGSAEMYVRIGGVLALEQIVQDAPEQADHAAQVLGQFIRDRTPDAVPTYYRSEVRRPDRPEADVQAALTALTRPASRQHVEPSRRIDLSDLHLCTANLHGADLSGAKLHGADLTGADLTGADLQGAALYGADLSYASLHAAILRKVDLRGAHLRRADLPGADLYGARLSWTELDQVNLSRAVLINASLYGADLGRANLSEADLSGADLSGANLYAVDLSQANLSEANLYGADLFMASLYAANFSAADLSGANLTDADLHRTDLSGAKLQRVDLSDASRLLPGQLLAARSIVNVRNLPEDLAADSEVAARMTVEADEEETDPAVPPSRP